MLIARTPAARRPPASQCNRWTGVNERTNTLTKEATNRHDGSQYLLTKVITVTLLNTFIRQKAEETDRQAGRQTNKQTITKNE